MKNILLHLMNRTANFLEKDMEIEVIDQNLQVTCPNEIKLKKNTAMIGLGGGINSLVSVGSCEKLLSVLIEEFLEGEEIEYDEYNDIQDSICCEIVNIIVGNVLKTPSDGSVIDITPPILINEAKSLCKYKDSVIVNITTKTKFGDMLLSIVMQKDVLEKELEGYK